MTDGPDLPDPPAAPAPDPELRVVGGTPAAPSLLGPARRTRLHTPLWAYALVFAVGFAIVYFSTREIAEE